MDQLSYTTIASTGQTFYLKGKRPKLLIVSGTHGDEYEIVPLVEEMIIFYEKELPDFLYVPRISPSALAQHTHVNKDGDNVNRCFFENTKCAEAQSMMNLWSKYNFTTYVTFHEDVERSNEFYLYDGMEREFYKSLNLEHTKRFALLKRDIIAIGLYLFNGIDDTSDPLLGYQARNGYIHWPMTRNDHSSDYWLLVEAKKADHVINPEIPGKAAVEKKRAVLKAIFERLLVKKEN